MWEGVEVKHWLMHRGTGIYVGCMLYLMWYQPPIDNWVIIVFLCSLFVAINERK